MSASRLLATGKIPVAPPVPVCRTKGVDLSDLKAKELLEGYMPAGKIHAKNVFSVGNISPSGSCSCWKHIKEYSFLISVFLDATEGRAPKQKSFARQFEIFLRGHGHNWSHNDIENACNRFRIYFSTLLGAARETKSPPRGYADMQCLVDKVYVERINNQEFQIAPVQQYIVPLQQQVVPAQQYVAETDDSEIEEIPPKVKPPVPRIFITDDDDENFTTFNLPDAPRDIEELTKLLLCKKPSTPLTSDPPSTPIAKATTAGPMPKEYIQLTQDKKDKKKKRLSGKQPNPLGPQAASAQSLPTSGTEVPGHSAGPAVTPISSSVVPAPALNGDGINSIDIGNTIINNYKDLGGLDPSIIRKRVHSQAYHYENKRMKGSGYADADAKVSAQIYAKMISHKWSVQVGIV